jgi:hypothetical protein
MLDAYSTDSPHAAQKQSHRSTVQAKHACRHAPLQHEYEQQTYA